MKARTYNLINRKEINYISYLWRARRFCIDQQEPNLRLLSVIVKLNHCLGCQIIQAKSRNTINKSKDTGTTGLANQTNYLIKYNPYWWSKINFKRANSNKSSNKAKQRLAQMKIKTYRKSTKENVRMSYYQYQKLLLQKTHFLPMKEHQKSQLFIIMSLKQKFFRLKNQKLRLQSDLANS